VPYQVLLAAPCSGAVYEASHLYSRAQITEPPVSKHVHKYVIALHDIQQATNGTLTHLPSTEKAEEEEEQEEEDKLWPGIMVNGSGMSTSCAFPHDVEGQLVPSPPCAPASLSVCTQAHVASFGLQPQLRSCSSEAVQQDYHNIEA